MPTGKPLGVVGDVATANAGVVAAADAGGTYTAAEQTLINELKADYNAAVTLINELKETQNELLAALRNRGWLDR